MPPEILVFSIIVFIVAYGFIVTTTKILFWPMYLLAETIKEFIIACKEFVRTIMEGL